MPKVVSSSTDKLRRQAELRLYQDSAPYFKQTQEQGDRKEFLKAFFAVYWNRWPLCVIDFDNDPGEMEFKRGLREKEILKDLYWVAASCKVIAIDPWKEYMSVEQDRQRQRAYHRYMSSLPRPRPRPMIKIKTEPEEIVLAPPVSLDAGVRPKFTLKRWLELSKASMGRQRKYQIVEYQPSQPYPSTRTTSAQKIIQRVENNSYRSSDGVASQSTSFLTHVEERPASVGDPTATTTKTPLSHDPRVNLAHDIQYLTHLEDENEETPKQRAKPSDDPLKMWLPHRELFLQELLNLDGRGDQPRNQCGCCQTRPAGHAIFECFDCIGRDLKCKGCMLESHKENPLHRIQMWNGTFFERTSLKELGLRDAFTILDNTGIHSVAIDFCGCGMSSQSHVVQLLRMRLFPATVANPQTAATFDTLKTFELLSYESKVSAFQFYNMLSRITDNTGLSKSKDRYQSFMVMIREWRYLKMLKRGARGYEDNGINTTPLGSCAVECPACPHPDKNMPDNWENGPEDKQWLHALFVGIDANFRLKRKDVSSDECDPDLGRGFAYFVLEEPFKAYLDKFEDEVEPKSNCSRHNAIEQANSRYGQGLAATGVATVECIRHDMKRPRSVGDLQIGEKYRNIDYIFYWSIVGSKLRCFVVAYDIACQWSIHLRERMFNLDHDFLIFNDQVHVRFFVPKFHLPAHVLPCRSNFSFNYGLHVGRTDGEAPERGWANSNPLASSTKEMGPGSRRDTLDSHFADGNWRKTIAMGRHLLRKLKLAVTELTDHYIAHFQLSASLPKDLVVKWTKEVETWEKNPKEENPFVSKTTTPTIAAVRLELAQAEGANAGSQNESSLDERVSPSVLIMLGIEIEANQRNLKVEAAKIWTHSQDRQRTKLQLQCNSLQRKISAWVKVNQIYIPNTATLVRAEELSALAQRTPLTPYTQTLWLPSNIGVKATFDLHLAEVEWKLRVAQACEALDIIRSNLQVRSHLFHYKDRFVRGQHANTRARATIETVEATIQSAAEEYRAGYRALKSLSILLQGHSDLGEIGILNWDKTLLPLEPGDIRELSEADSNKTSEGRRKISWIWRTRGVINDENDVEDLRDALRVEWCKSRARSMRFSEEVDLLQEEMERVLRFFTYRERWWLSKTEYGSSGDMRPIRQEGLVAYASRQAALCASLRTSFNLFRIFTK
ncbi:hypothetical protein H0H93_010409 [Arthromyces matolae]|nr:hypothetical protein H0H93_010409 [Arthromyces matolae]